MATIKHEEVRGKFYNVLGSTGKFHLKVEEGTEGAQLRKYESSDGTKGEKWELIASEVTGIIDNISIFEGEYGKNILVAFKLEEGETEADQIIVSLGVNSPFGEQFMEKLPAIDISKEVTLAPYSFEDDNGKAKKGLTVKQGETKHTSQYSEYDEKAKKWKQLKGLPAPEGDTTKFDSDDWKAYFIKKRKFLLEEVSKHPLFVAEGKSAEEDIQAVDIEL